MNCLFQAESSPPSLSNPTRNREICGIRAICGSNGPFPLQSPPIGGPTPESFLRQPGPIRMNPRLRVCHGDLLEQPVEVIVNAWNRNFIPWWLLLPQGVSGAIKKRAGYAPFRELARAGVLPLGGAVVTSAGRLPFRAIIHVAGIGWLWTSSEESIRTSVQNALRLAAQHGFRSIAFPFIGAGTGGTRADHVQTLMTDEFQRSTYPGEIILVRYSKPTP
jgi:O-acetyl-ADP-ribose deacetylase (regulator of RNase III)